MINAIHVSHKPTLAVVILATKAVVVVKVVLLSPDWVAGLIWALFFPPIVMINIFFI